MPLDLLGLQWAHQSLGRGLQQLQFPGTEKPSGYEETLLRKRICVLLASYVPIYILPELRPQEVKFSTIRIKEVRMHLKFLQ